MPSLVVSMSNEYNIMSMRQKVPIPLTVMSFPFHTYKRKEKF